MPSPPISIVALVLVAIGWREALVVAIVIPVTILLTLFAAWIMGYTLNRVSLFALIFSIGILVDDAIVVIENIARHWAMKREGQSPFGAAIAAVAEVGNPTIVATLTVVVALLPMLFVSGLMGPYMSPIPAVASAAMIFSFFVAVMITPWLMLKIAGPAHAGHHAEDGSAHPGGRLGRAYAAVARPLLKSKWRSALFLLVVAVLSFGSLTLLYTRDVTVKLLPFDNKSELSVVIDMPEGASVETTDAIAQRAARLALSLPEVISAQTHAGTAAAFDFNGLVRHYYLRSSPELGQVQVNLAPKGERDRTSHDIALELRERLATLDVPEGTVLKTVEPPPGPPVIATLLAEVYGPDAPTRRAVAGRVRAAFEDVPFVVDVDDSTGTPPRRLRVGLEPTDLEFYRVEERDVLQTLRLLNGTTTVGYSHRGGGRPPIPIVLARARADQVMDERALSTPVPANVLPGSRGVVELGDVVAVSQEHASYPIFRHNGYEVIMVTGELAGTFEAPLYGMLAVGDRLEAMDWTEVAQPVIRLNGQPEDTTHAGLALGRRVGGDLDHLPRHGRGVSGGAPRHLHPRRGAVRLVPPAAGDPDPGAAHVPGHHGRALAFQRSVLGDVDDRFHRPCRDHRAQLDPARGLHPPRRPRRPRHGRDAGRGRRRTLQADPSDCSRGDDRRRGHPRRPDLPGPRDLASLRPAVVDSADRAGDPGDLPPRQDVSAAMDRDGREAEAEIPARGGR